MKAKGGLVIREQFGKGNIIILLLSSSCHSLKLPRRSAFVCLSVRYVHVCPFVHLIMCCVSWYSWTET